jgi:hypothetical protein
LAFPCFAARLQLLILSLQAIDFIVLQTMNDFLLLPNHFRLLLNGTKGILKTKWIKSRTCPYADPARLITAVRQSSLS